MLVSCITQLIVLGSLLAAFLLPADPLLQVQTHAYPHTYPRGWAAGGQPAFGLA